MTTQWQPEPEILQHLDEAVLDAIVRGGLALREAQDEAGMWMFRKKDYSEWGPIRMPWAYSRWMRAFAVVRDAMPDEARRAWEDGLQLGYAGIAAEDMGRIHNIPTHHAMGLYCAGQVFDRSQWRDQAADFLRRVAAEQTEHGWWAEHDGPVVMYNFVYADALGAYFSMSGDTQVLPALERAAAYHATFTYPDGSCVETIDGRNPYHTGVRLGNAGLTRSAAGRGWTAQQHRLHLAAGQRFDADYAASMLAYCETGEAETPPGARDISTQRMGDGAITQRRAPWFTCLSAYPVDIPLNRFGQDRQNFISLYHDDVGLIAGGGSTKLQPLWSTFTVGDTSLLKHTPGEEEPDFAAVPGLIHCPQTVDLGSDDRAPGITLHYGDTAGRVETQLEETEARLTFSVEGDAGQDTAAHLSLLPHLGEVLRSGVEEVELGEESVDWTVPADGVIAHGGWELRCSAGSRLRWPVLPHNPYRKDGHATVEEARMVLTMPMSSGVSTTVKISVVG